MKFRSVLRVVPLLKHRVEIENSEKKGRHNHDIYCFDKQVKFEKDWHDFRHLGCLFCFVWIHSRSKND